MVLVYIETQTGEIKKSGYEAVVFGKQIANLKSCSCKAIVTKSIINLDLLGNYGVDEVILCDNENELDNAQIATLISKVAQDINGHYIVMSNSSLGKSIAGRVAIKTNKSLISGVSQITQQDNSLLFKKAVYSGKAFAYYKTANDQAVIAISPNSLSPVKTHETKATITTKLIEIPSSKIKLISQNLVKGKIPLTEAETVVSAGRGMRDPSNWGMIEELSDLIGASTACSRPVADIGWRPHHEHVGQTGTAIKPNLYIAIGISGAIQHLAGVNSSRKIIVINKDPEAPFFKAADYGICGDLFEIVPKLNEAIRNFKSTV